MRTTKRQKTQRRFRYALSLLATFLVVGCGGGNGGEGDPQRSAAACAAVAPGNLSVQSDATTISIFALGDTGRGNDGQRAVAEALSLAARNLEEGAVLLLGDNFYENGVNSVSDPQWQTKFVDMYDVSLPFYPVAGNHDHQGNVVAQIHYTQHSNRWKMPSCYYSVTYTLRYGETVQLIALDTTILASTEPGVASTQLEWLRGILRNSRAAVKLVYGHHPVISSGHHGDDAETSRIRELLSPLLLKYDVKYYLSGHDHHLEILESQSGVTQIISGAGAKANGPGKTPASLFASSSLGYARLIISSKQIVLEFVDQSNRVLFSQTDN